MKRRLSIILVMAISLTMIFTTSAISFAADQPDPSEQPQAAELQTPAPDSEPAELQTPASDSEPAELQTPAELQSTADQKSPEELPELGSPEEMDYPYVQANDIYLYCEHDSSLEGTVNGIYIKDIDTKNHKSVTIVLDKYDGGCISVSGFLDVNREVKNRSIIYGHNNNFCIWVSNNLTITGSPQLCMANMDITPEYGSSVKEPIGIYVSQGDLTLDNANLYFSETNGARVNGDFNMLGGRYETLFTKDFVLSCWGVADNHGGTIADGCDFEQHSHDDGIETIIARGAVWDDVNKTYGGTVVPNVIMTGGQISDSSKRDSELKWKIDKYGKLTVAPQGTNTVIKSDNADWNQFGKTVRTIEIQEGITEIYDEVFDKCTGATSIKFPKSLDEMNARVLKNMTKLKTITVAKGNKRYKSIDGILYDLNYGSKPAILVRYPAAKVKKYYTIPSTVTTLNSFALSGAKVTYLTLPKNIIEIGDSAFASSRIKKITVASSNPVFKIKSRNLITKDGADLYWYSPLNTKRIYTVPDSFTRVISGAFTSNKYIMAVIFGENMQYIGYHAFNCPNLRDLLFRGSQPWVQGDGFTGITENAKVISLKSQNWSFEDSDWKDVRRAEVDNIDNYLPNSIESFSQKQTIWCGLEYEGIRVYSTDGIMDNGIVSSSSRYLKASFDPDEYYNVRLYSEKAGTYTVTVKSATGASCKVTIDALPCFPEFKYDIYYGESKTIKLKYLSDQTKAAWSSDDKSIATVNKYGKVTAKAEGHCVITARYHNVGYTYDLIVSHEKPGRQYVYYCNSKGQYSENCYNRSRNYFYVRVNNRGKHAMTIYSKGTTLQDGMDGDAIRNLTLASGASSVSVAPGKSKTIVYKIAGKKLSTNFDPESSRMEYQFKLNGIKYNAVLDNTNSRYQVPGTDGWLELGEAE